MTSKQRRPTEAEAKKCLELFQAINKRIGKHATGAEPYRNLRKRLNSSWPGVKVEQVLAKFGPYPRCYLTGIELDLSDGKTFQLDHVLARNKGGLSTFANMQITYPQANRMKLNYDLEEFIRLCRLVTKKWS